MINTQELQHVRVVIVLEGKLLRCHRGSGRLFSRDCALSLCSLALLKESLLTSDLVRS